MPRLFFQLLVPACCIEALLVILVSLKDSQTWIVDTILIQLLTGLFYLVSCYFSLRESSQRESAGGRRPDRFVLAAAIVFRLTVWPLAPGLSDDVYRYRWEGQLQAAGGNPYQVRPNDAAASHLRDDAFSRVPARDFKAGYGPLTELLEHITYRVISAFTSDPHRQAFWFKLPAALFDLATILAIRSLLRVRGLPPSRLLIYAWSPLAIVEFWASGHNDSMPVFFTVIALVMAAGSRYWLAFALLGFGVAAKFWPVLLAPVIAAPHGKRLRWREPVALFVAPALFALPFWSDVWENARFMSGFVGGWRNNDSLYGLLLWWTGDIYQAKYLAFAIATAAVIAVCFLRWTLEARCAAALAALLLVSANAHPWYLTWFLPMLAAAPSVSLLLWTVLAPLAYSSVIKWSILGEWDGVPPIRWLIYVPVFVMMIVEAGIRLRSRAERFDLRVRPRG